MRSVFPAALLLLASCARQAAGDPCAAAFEPYADHVTGRARDSRNGAYIDAMASYARGDYREAAAALGAYLDQRGADRRAYLYLAVSQLAAGQPYEAELSLDKLRQSNLPGFKDPLEWYTVLCWLCSGQEARALEGARRIAAGPHTYREQARRLAATLERHAP